MMRLSDAAAAIGAEFSGADASFDAVGTDTRKSLQGALYIALRGERFDGHEFLAQAAEQGAVGAMVSGVALQAPAGLALLRVADTRLGLGSLGSWWRQQFQLPLIGVTGSNGKTTVKEMCAAILRAHYGPDAVLATQGNLNNDIGLPQMLLRLSGSHRAAVIEMGMNHPGEIAYLAGLARPQVAVVTNAQRAHLEGMGQLSAVANEKGAIYEALDDGGVAVINADDPHLGLWRKMAGARRVITFGLGNADVTGSVQSLPLGSRITLQAFGERRIFDLAVPGLHNVRNALGAAAATLAAGVPLDAVAAGLASYTGTKGRLQVRRARHGALLLDDTYNANPDSVRAGIDVLAATPGKTILVLGDMGEIGDMSAQCHDEIGGYAKSQGLDHLLALGEHSSIAARNFGGGGEHFESIEALVAALEKLLAPDVVVLVKGSRFMRMERVSDLIAEN